MDCDVLCVLSVVIEHAMRVRGSSPCLQSRVCGVSNQSARARLASAKLAERDPRCAVCFGATTAAVICLPSSMGYEGGFGVLNDYRQPRRARDGVGAKSLIVFALIWCADKHYACIQV